MNELDRVLEAAEEWAGRGVEFALATVVGVRGSTYRGLAARQLVGVDGSGVGTVSGGCLDQDLAAVAARVIESGTAELVEFDLTADDEAIWGWGIGCNGATRLVVEPAATVVEFVDQVKNARRPLAVIHQLGDALGQRSLVGATSATGAVAEALREGSHRLAEIDGEPVMIEVLGASRRLVVCGAGHDAAPMVRFAAELGFDPVLVDDRRQFLSAERFPQVAQLVHVAPAELAGAVELDGSAFVIIMSHNYLRDLDYLASTLGTGVPYIGVLGPGERLQRLLDDLEERGVTLTDEDRDALHGPAGLDLGAEGPVEIAWAVMAEVLAVRRRAEGSRLRERKGPQALRLYHQG